MRKRVNVWDIIINFFLIFVALLTIYPFIYALAGSFNNGREYDVDFVWLYPKSFTLANYQVVFADTRLWRALLNTLIRTAGGTVAALIITSLVAYAMSNPDLKGKKIFQAVNLFTMFFSGGIVPFYMLVNVLGIYDTFWVYILPSLYSVYNMIVMSNFFRGIPDSFREAATMDGAGEFVIWFMIYIPLSKAVFATVGLWIIVMHWNSYMPTLLYTSRGAELWTLQYYLKVLIRDSGSPSVTGDLAELVSTQTITFAAMVVAIIPIVLAYPAFQKYFSKGSLVGAIKE